MFSQDSGLYMTGNNAAMMDPKKGANFWSNRVLPVYVELFEKGAFQKPAFGIMGDYQISGQYSRAKQKKSFSVTMREEYGEKRLKYALFPDYPELNRNSRSSRLSRSGTSVTTAVTTTCATVLEPR